MGVLSLSGLLTLCGCAPSLLPVWKARDGLSVVAAVVVWLALGHLLSPSKKSFIEIQQKFTHLKCKIHRVVQQSILEYSHLPQEKPLTLYLFSESPSLPPTPSPE